MKGRPITESVLGAGFSRPLRRGYIDWLRGIAVLIMIEAHTIDSWTLVSERSRPGFGYAIILGGFGAPIFLFLAGIAIALAAGSRLRKGASTREAAAAAVRRGLQIFALALLFRLQSWALSGGGPLDPLFKVDILNIMGLAMLAAAALWGITRRDEVRVAALALAAIAVAMATPLVRAAEWMAILPDPIEAYLRPVPGRTTFTLFPWTGFLFAGAAIGAWLNRVRADAAEWRFNVALAIAGPVIAIVGYAASFLPPIYEDANFWTSSPTFFFLRLGILMSLLPLAYAWERRPGRGRRWEVLQEFGRASLFVYWIHVEMAYGVVSIPIHKRFTFEQTVLALALFTVFLFGLVKLKERIVRTRAGKSSLQPAHG